MGLWSAIKHAMNSTLGTSEFEPLDKIIKGQRIYVATDSFTLLKLSGNPLDLDSYEDPSEKKLYSFSTQLAGTVNLTIPLVATSYGNASYILVLTDSKGNEQRYSILGIPSALYSSVGIDLPQSYTGYTTVSLEANETYTIGILPKGENAYRASVNSITINGIIIEGQALKKVEE